MSGEGDTKSQHAHAGAARKRRKELDTGSMLERGFSAGQLNPTRYSKGMPQSSAPCVLCVYASSAETEKAGSACTTLGEIEQRGVFDAIYKLWSTHVASTELVVLAEQCMAMVQELRLERGAEVDEVLEALDSQMIYTHMLHHQSCRASRIARLRQAFYNTSELERVAAQSLYIKEKDRLLPHAGAVDIHRRAITSLLSISAALTREEGGQTR
jgi:hypothetical protein